MQMPGRTFNTGSSYRYGFNGKENDNEVKNKDGSQQDYGMRIYDTRVGRFLSVDPLTQEYPWYTPYQFAGNKPIWAVDLDGMEEYYSNTGNYLGHGKDSKNNELRMATKYEPLKDNKGNEIKDQNVIFSYKKITLKEPGKELEKLYSDAQKAGGPDGKERAGLFILDANKAELYFKRADVERNNTSTSSENDLTHSYNGTEYLYGQMNQVVIGQIHTHQAELSYVGKKTNDLNGRPITITDIYSFNYQYTQPSADGSRAMTTNRNIFTIGINVDYYSPLGRKFSMNNITTKNKLFNNTFNILQFALKKNAESKK